MAGQVRSGEAITFHTLGLLEVDHFTSSASTLKMILKPSHQVGDPGWLQTLVDPDVCHYVEMDVFRNGYV